MLGGEGERRPLAAPLALSLGPWAAALEDPFRGVRPLRVQEGQPAGFHSGFYLFATSPD